jgi:hypothetical protein
MGRLRIRPASSSGRRMAGRRVYLNKGGIEHSTVHNNQIVADFFEVLTSINKENFEEEIHHSTSTISPRVVAKEPF